jgi:Response regulator of the LytR/AlgR family
MSGKALRVMVVDDEQLAREELCFLLGQSGGIEIAAQAGDGVQALQLCEELQPDLLFLDVQMPGLTGFEVARRLLAAQALRRSSSSRPSINTPSRRSP